MKSNLRSVIPTPGEAFGLAIYALQSPGKFASRQLADDGQTPAGLEILMMMGAIAGPMLGAALFGATSFSSIAQLFKMGAAATTGRLKSYLQYTESCDNPVKSDARAAVIGTAGAIVASAADLATHGHLHLGGEAVQVPVYLAAAAGYFAPSMVAGAALGTAFMGAVWAGFGAIMVKRATTVALLPAQISFAVARHLNHGSTPTFTDYLADRQNSGIKKVKTAWQGLRSALSNG